MDEVLLTYIPVIAVFLGAVLGSWFSSIASSTSAPAEQVSAFDKLQKVVGIIMLALTIVSAIGAAGEIIIPATFGLFLTGYIAGVGGSYAAKSQKKVPVE
jgi:hypothetical protein